MTKAVPIKKPVPILNSTYKSSKKTQVVPGVNIWESWEPTSELAYIYVPGIAGILSRKVLHQKWRNIDSFRTEWRLVPTLNMC